MGSIEQDIPTLDEAILGANELYDLVILTAADDLIEATAPTAWRAAWRLRSKDAQPQADLVEGFGSLLALRTILQTPNVLQETAQRLYKRLSALMRAEMGAGDCELMAVLQGIEGDASDPAKDSLEGAPIDVLEMGFASVAAMAQRLTKEIQTDKKRENFFDRVCLFSILVDQAIKPELAEADPHKWEIARNLFEFERPGFELAGILVTLDIMQAHPALMAEVVAHLRIVISALLLGGGQAYLT